MGTGVGGIGQFFLVSHRFSEADPVLGKEVPCLTGALGMSSSDRGLQFWVRGCPSFWGLVVRQGTSANCPVANLYTVTSLDLVVDLVTGVCVEVLATVGAGAVDFTGVVGVVGTGWASTLTLYFLLVSMVFFLLSLVLGPRAFLIMGLVLGWVGHGWVCCGQVWSWGLGLGPSFHSNSK